MVTNYEERLKVTTRKNTIDLYTESKLKVATGYERIVIGKRGPYVEFSSPHILVKNLYIPDDQRYRVDSQTTYYIEYKTVQDNVKVYLQKRTVDYADYLPGLWYISPFDLFLLDNERNTLVKLIDPIRK